MKTWIDFDGATVFVIPLRDGPGHCEGMLIEGPQGWGEFSPPPGCDDPGAGRWLTAAIEVGTVGWPDPLRGQVDVAAHVGVVEPARAAQIVAESGCSTASVAVGGELDADIARLEAVRDALGPGRAIRCDVGGAWDPETAVAVTPLLDRAAGGLEFIEDPCASASEIAGVRARLEVPVAIGRTIGDAALAGGLAAVADIVTLRVGPLGGVRRALRVAETCDLPCVVRSGWESSIGTAGALALAGVLPDSGFAHDVSSVALLDGDLVSAARSLVVSEGRLPVAPMPPGPDPDRLQCFAATDAARIAWWRDRLARAQAFI